MKTLPFRYEVMDGKGNPMFIDFRRATPDDLDKVLSLQDAIMDALPDKDLYAPFTKEESPLIETDSTFPYIFRVKNPSR